MENFSAQPTGSSVPQWKPISATDRRVAAVIVEKAKTTPDQYPLTVNSIRNGANQKSNRYPLMQLDDDDVQESLDRLRSMGAVIEVHDSGRAVKYRHRMYEWLGVEKVEMAVMTELLLRGAQTVGELRGRAARMDPIPDLATLQPVLGRLEEQGLIVYLTPPGRGCVLTHQLYLPEELARLRKEYGTPSAVHAGPEQIGEPRTTTPLESRPAPPRSPSEPAGVLNELVREVTELRQMLDDSRTQLGELAEYTKSLRAELDDLKQQLGA